MNWTLVREPKQPSGSETERVVLSETVPNDANKYVKNQHDDTFGFRPGGKNKLR